LTVSMYLELQIQERVSWNTKERTHTEHRILPSTLSLSQWVGLLRALKINSFVTKNNIGKFAFKLTNGGTSHFV
jgi:hypothetical protein